MVDTETPKTKYVTKSDKRFVDYYDTESLSEENLLRTQMLFDRVHHLFQSSNQEVGTVADIGCGAGTQSMIWARNGYRVQSIDVNSELVDIARARAQKELLEIDFRVGTATDLPWSDESVDICIAPELLEHVADWQTCLNEFIRILKPNGILYLSTSNRLCPAQEEFELPLYSWYPGFIKRHFVELAMTTRPELANFAEYPAVNWFDFYRLRKELEKRSMSCLDRFRFAVITDKASTRTKIFQIVSSIALLRFIGHVFTPYTMIVATKHSPIAPIEIPPGPPHLA